MYFSIIHYCRAFGAIKQCAIFWNYLGSRVFTVKTCFILSHSVYTILKCEVPLCWKKSGVFSASQTSVFQVEQSLRLPSRNICLRHFSCYCLLFDSEQYNGCMSWKMVNIVTTYNFDILSFALEKHYWIYYRLWTEKQWLRQLLTKPKCKA